MSEQKPRGNGTGERLRKHSDVSRLANLTDEELMALAPPVPARPPTRSLGHPASHSDPCPRCGLERPGNLVYFGRSYCGCGPKLRAAERALERADAAGAMTSSSLAADSDPSVLHAASVLREIAYGNPSDGRGPRKRGVFMFGLPGRGKTHLSVATAREVLAGGRLVGLYSLAELVSRVQDTYGYSDGAETKTRIIEEVCSHDVVVLDDFGKEHRSPDTESIVYMLVDGLYRARRTLVASSNLPGRDFVERYDGAVLSRLGGMCEKLVIRGEDRRAREWEW